jgi:DNA-binding HxlR family transcriptional regulator
VRERTLLLEPCSVARSIEIVGDPWALMVIREAFLGVRRFEEMRRRLGVAPNVLSDRLDMLVRHGIVKRVPYQDRPVRHEYRLAQKGLDLYPAVVALMRWGERYTQDPAPVILRHRACGNDIIPVMACPHCREEITALDVDARPRPRDGASA